MKTRQLGKAELELPVVVLGAWAIGGWQWGGTDDEAALVALRAAPDHGITAIDTAPIYGFGHSERIVGEAIRGRREAYSVLTKVGLVWEDTEGVPVFEGTDQEGAVRKVYKNSRPASVRREVDASLERLGVETLDLVQVHWRDESTPIAETMGALAELRDEGKLRAIGVSNFDADEIVEAQDALGDIPLASVQPRYSLIFRENEREVFPCCLEHGVGTLVYSPLAMGLLSGKVTLDREFPEDDLRSRRPEFRSENRAKVIDAVERSIVPVARRIGATPAQVALAWTVAQPGVTSAIAGIRNSGQLAENAAAGDLELDSEDLETIRATFEALRLDMGDS